MEPPPWYKFPIELLSGPSRKERFWRVIRKREEVLCRLESLQKEIGKELGLLFVLNHYLEQHEAVREENPQE